MWQRRSKAFIPAYPAGMNELSGADDRARTGDLDLGKVALYQLSYVRVDINSSPRSCRNRSRLPRSRAESGDLSTTAASETSGAAFRRREFFDRSEMG
jgi:hypothetical protein